MSPCIKPPCPCSALKNKKAAADKYPGVILLRTACREIVIRVISREQEPARRPGGRRRMRLRPVNENIGPRIALFQFYHFGFGHRGRREHGFEQGGEFVQKIRACYPLVLRGVCSGPRVKQQENGGRKNGASFH